MISISIFRRFGYIKAGGNLYFLNSLGSVAVNRLPLLDILFQIIYAFRISAAAFPHGCNMTIGIGVSFCLKRLQTLQLFTRPFFGGLSIFIAVINRQVTKENVCDPVDPCLIKWFLANLVNGNMIRVRKFNFSPAG